MVERLNDAEGIAAYELNVSCPNVHAGGMTFGADCGSLEYLVGGARGLAPSVPIIVKLSPNVTSIAQMARRRRAMPAPTPSAWSTPFSPCPSTWRPASRA